MDEAVEHCGVTRACLGDVECPVVAANHWTPQDALDVVTNGNAAGPDACIGYHLHDLDDSGIFIDGLGPFADPDHTGCGYGAIVAAP